jgi:cell division septal protein FtsQ
MATDDDPIGGPRREERADEEPAHRERQLGTGAQGRRRILLAVGAAILLVVIVAIVLFLTANAADDVEGAGSSAVAALAALPLPSR